MNAIFFFITFATSLFQFQNLTIDHLTVKKYIDHSPLYSFSKGSFFSKIKLSTLILNQFSSPAFLYYSSFHNTDISNSNFKQFIFTSLFIDEQLYNDQFFTSYVEPNSNTNFTRCTFQMNLNYDDFITLQNNQFQFYDCIFIDSNLDQSSIISIKKCKLNINNSIFTENKGIGSKIIFSKQMHESDINIDFTNFSSNIMDSELMFLAGQNIKISKCCMISNDCSKCLTIMEINLDSFDAINLNNMIIIQNQIKTDNPTDFIFYTNNLQHVIEIDHFIINEEIIFSIFNYFHFKVSNDVSLIHLCNCCLSNPRENWVSGKLIDAGGNTENDDCLNLHLKTIIEYGIIANETIEFQIPKRIQMYFLDSDQE